MTGSQCRAPVSRRNDGLELHPARIVRAFAGDRDVMDVAFAQARVGDADELRLLVEFGEVAGADIAHRGAKAAGELVQHVADRALVGHLAFDAFRHQLQRVLDVLLEIAVGRAARHGADRAHAAIGLVGAALIQKDLARALVGAGQQRADHGDVRAGGERLGEIAGIFDAAVGDHRHVGFVRRLDRIHDRGQLRHADAGDDARGADRARADADLDRVGAGIDQRLRAFGGRDIAGDDLHGIGELLDAVDGFETRCEWPCAVSTTTRSTPASMSRSARSIAVLADAWSPRRRAAGPARPCRRADGRRLLHVLDGDQADASILLVDDDQLLDAMLMQQPLRLVLARRLRAP